MDTIDEAFARFADGFAKTLRANATDEEYEAVRQQFAASENLDTDDSEQSRIDNSIRKVVLEIDLHRSGVIEQVEGLAKINPAKTLVSRSFLLTLVSQYDAFLASLIRALYVIKPDIFNVRAKSLTYEEVLAYGDIKSLEKNSLTMRLKVF